jgi:hypothetical protein
MAENAVAKRIAVDQEHRYSALASLLDHEGAVRRDNGVFHDFSHTVLSLARDLEQQERLVPA